MSSSTQDPQDEGDDKQPLDELDEPIGGKNESDVVEKDAPAKRGRGRPKGSKNKRQSMTSAATVGSSTGITPRKRGRPPKEKKPEGEGDTEPPTKRKRGRPPKNATKPETSDDAAGSGEATESSGKKKRGRPKKTAD